MVQAIRACLAFGHLEEDERDVSMESTNDSDVVVIGCGNMGSAFVRALAAQGYRVAVWNRTASRAEQLAATIPGVTAYADVRAATAGSSVIVACVTVYDALTSVLDEAGSLRGRTLINLTTGSPEEAWKMGAWAEQQGVNYLDSVITVYPRQVGREDAQIMVSGPVTLWEKNKDILRTLGGGAIHVSDDLSVANVLDVGLVGAFYISALTGFIEAAAYALDQGVSPESLLQSALPVIRLLEGAAEEAVHHIESRSFDVHDASVAIFGEAARAMAATIRGTGNSAHILAASAGLITRAEESGLAGSSLASITGILSHDERINGGTGG